MHKANISLCY